MITKKGRGGAREGAGRKPQPHGNTHTFRASVEAEALLSEFKGSKAKMISDAIVYYLTNKK